MVFHNDLFLQQILHGGWISRTVGSKPSVRVVVSAKQNREEYMVARSKDWKSLLVQFTVPNKGTTCIIKQKAFGIAQGAHLSRKLLKYIELSKNPFLKMAV